MKKEQFDISCYDENLKDYVNGLMFIITKLSKENTQLKTELHNAYKRINNN
jgi:hypothetical protein